MPAVISDTTALNYLARIGQFGLLRLQFQKVFVPPAVLAELTLRPDLPGEKCVQTAISEGWLEMRSPQNRDAVEKLPMTLGAGESAAIALAQQLPASYLLIDEAAGHAVAESLPLNLIGTTGLLLRARKAGHIPRLKPVLDDLIQQHGFRLSRKVYIDALHEVGESE